MRYASLPRAILALVRPRQTVARPKLSCGRLKARCFPRCGSTPIMVAKNSTKVLLLFQEAPSPFLPSEPAFGETVIINPLLFGNCCLMALLPFTTSGANPHG